MSCFTKVSVDPRLEPEQRHLEQMFQVNREEIEELIWKENNWEYEEGYRKASGQFRSVIW